MEQVEVAFMCSIISHSHLKSCISTLIKPLLRGVLLLKYDLVLLEQYHYLKIL